MDNDEKMDRIVSKIDGLFETVTYIKTEQGVISSKLDAFSDSIQKLEDRDDKHLERAENIERALTKLETIVETYMKTTDNLENKVEALEKEITIIKNNWGWLSVLAGAVGSAISFGISVALHFINK